MRPKRDLRIDFFRGLALLIVLVDHLEGLAGQSVVEQWTLISLGFSDAAEIFIFLSGYVLAVAYAPVLASQGMWGCVKKALRRSLQIYVAYVLAALTVLVAGALLLSSGPPNYNDYFRIGEHFGSSLLAVFTLRYHPWGFDILALYVVLLPAMAVMLAIQRRAPEIAWIISIAAYLLVQVARHVNLPRFGDSEGWYFNPLAWQLLFFIGLYIGDPQRRRLSLNTRWPLMLASAIMVLAGLFVLKISPLLTQSGLFTFEQFLPMYRFYWEWADKTTLQPLRIVHFFALAYLTSILLPRNLPFWTSRLSKPLVVAGQHSLEVYAFGLVVSFWGAFAISRGLTSPVAIIAIDLIACVVSLLFAYAVQGWKMRSRTPILLDQSHETATSDLATKQRDPKSRKKSRRKLAVKG